MEGAIAQLNKSLGMATYLFKSSIDGEVYRCRLVASGAVVGPKG